MDFEVWLKQFNKKQEPIGDLARDFRDSGCYTIKESFEKFPPCQAAIDTYKKARRAYILELANILHNEISHIITMDRHEETMWHQSLRSLHDLCDTLADLDSYLDNGLEEDE
jgi:hypothetical protein